MALVDHPWICFPQLTSSRRPTSLYYNIRMSNNKLLITGINGRIGSIIRDPLGESYQVLGCDRKGPFSDRIHQVDIAESNAVNQFFKEKGGFPYLVHLAANPHVDAPWEDVLQSNIIGTRNIYHAAREFGTRRVVFASSNHVTGAYEGFPPRLHLKQDPELITVADPIRPDSEYGVSKAFGEALARYYYERWDIASVSLRIGSVLEDDDPGSNPRHAKTWLSHRDLVQLVEKSLAAGVKYGIYYGVSDNDGRFWDLTKAREELGYRPQDNAAEVL